VLSLPFGDEVVLAKIPSMEVDPGEALFEPQILLRGIQKSSKKNHTLYHVTPTIKFELYLLGCVFLLKWDLT